MKFESLDSTLANLMIRRFYLRQAGKLFYVPLYMSAILDQANFTWTPNKSRALLSSDVQPMMELSPDDVQLMRKYIVQVNVMLAFYKPYINPSLSRVEISMLSRIGVTQLDISKL